MRQAQPAISIAAWLYRALALFVAAACAVTLAAGPIVHAYDAGRVDVVEARERGFVEAAALDIQNAVHEVLADLRVAASLPSMRLFINRGTDEEKAVLAGAFQNIMEAYGRYDQIRLLDTGGREIVRVNDQGGRAVVVLQEELQDKSARYYVKEAAGLNRGQIYLSPLDLNVENGTTQVPYEPMLRAATPVFDGTGNKRGILILNARGESLLERFREVMKAEPLHQAMLLNPDGYWLSNAGKGEWGFMFGRSDATFGHAYPDEWSTIAANDAGSIRSERGLFVFSTVAPVAGSTTGWKIVVLVSRETLAQRSLLRLPLGRTLFATIYTLLLLLSVLIAYISLYLKRSREADRAAAREIEDLYERAPCGYYSIDRNGLIVRMNQTELNWLGYRADEVIGKKHITDLLSGQGREIFNRLFPSFIRTGQLIDQEVDLVRRDGSLLPVVVNASAVRDSAGNYVMSRSTVFDATERRKLENELLKQANTDVLTGIGNRRQFFELAGRELSRSIRSGSPLSLLLLDIDGFKRINDEHGHEAGDAVLKTFTATVAAVLRDTDVFGRIGGEEFAVLLPDTDNEEAQVLAERVREQVALFAVSSTQGRVLSVTVSIGIAALIPGDEADNIDAMLRRADAALYEAKNAGRNQVRTGA